MGTDRQSNSGTERTFDQFITSLFVGLVSYIAFSGLHAVFPNRDMNHNVVPLIPALCIVIVQPLFRRPARQPGASVPVRTTRTGIVACVTGVVVAIMSALMIAAELREAGINLTPEQWDDGYHTLIRNLEGWTFVGSVAVIVVGRIAYHTIYGRIAMLVGGVVFGLLILWSMFGQGPSSYVLL